MEKMTRRVVLGAVAGAPFLAAAVAREQPLGGMVTPFPLPEDMSGMALIGSVWSGSPRGFIFPGRLYSLAEWERCEDRDFPRIMAQQEAFFAERAKKPSRRLG